MAKTSKELTVPEGINYSELRKRYNFKEHTLYRVAISMSEGNPTFYATLYVGFTTGNAPAGYSVMMAGGDDEIPRSQWSAIKFMQVTPLCSMDSSNMPHGMRWANV